MRVQSGYYQNIFEETAALMKSLANSHPFLEENTEMTSHF